MYFNLEEIKKMVKDKEKATVYYEIKESDLPLCPEGVRDFIKANFIGTLIAGTIVTIITIMGSTTFQFLIKTL